MGPMLHRAIKPKLSLAPSLSLRAADKPTPSAMMKGTVIGPVVTPPASNATAINSEGAKKDNRNSSTYRTVSIFARLILNRMRRTAMVVKTPTPVATVQISTWLGIEATWLASTCKPGSEMVMIAPIAKHTAAIHRMLLLFTSLPPTPWPSGVIAISAPS